MSVLLLGNDDDACQLVTVHSQTQTLSDLMTVVIVLINPESFKWLFLLLLTRKEIRNQTH